MKTAKAKWLDSQVILSALALVTFVGAQHICFLIDGPL